MKTHLMAHHSLTKDQKVADSQAIRRYHMEVNKWRDIGYHLLVERVGEHYEVIAGRPLLARAAAAYQQGMNRKAIHVCFIGNYDLKAPPLEMLQFAAPHLADVMELAGILPTDSSIIGHRAVASYKSCPGKMFDMEILRTILRGEM